MVSNEISNRTKEISWLQWMGGIGAMTVLFVTALMRGWSSPYLAQLTAANSPILVTTDEASWIASLLNLGRLVGAVMGAVSVQYFGSKKTLLVIGFPLAFGWVLVIVANSVIWLYLARLACGIGMGMAYSSFPLYLGEVSSPAIRGSLVTLALSGVALGTLSGNVMGTYVSMEVFSYISLVPTVIFIIIFIWLPESPHDLTRMDRMEDAKKSILRYNPKADAEGEIMSMREFVTATHSITFWDRLREFNIPHNRKAALIIVLLFFFMQFSGLNTVVFYMETILTDGMLTVIEPATMVIIVNALGTIAGLLATYIADKFERRTLLVSSSVGVFLSMVALGLHFALIDRGFDPSNSQWLPILSLIIFQLFLPVGVAIVPNMVLSELFASDIKSIAACLAGLATGAFSFASSKSYQPMVDAVGEAYVFWIYAGIMVLCVVFALTLMPETKRKTLQEIQDLLMKK